MSETIPQKPKLELKFRENIKSKAFWRAILSELVATAILIFLGCGSILLGTTPSPAASSADIMRISFTFGFAVTCLVWTFGPVSGAHLNPAVSFAVFCIGRVSLVRAVFYTIAQCIGSTLGISLVYAVVPPDKRGSLGITSLANGTEPIQGFACEVILTFILLMTICACVDEGRRDHGKGRAVIPLTIGFCIIVLNLMGIPYSGSSLNPARSFGPALISGIWDSHWIYWIGPICGGCLGSLVYGFLFSSAMHPDIKIRPPSDQNSPRESDAIGEVKLVPHEEYIPSRRPTKSSSLLLQDPPEITVVSDNAGDK